MMNRFKLIWKVVAVLFIVALLATAIPLSANQIESSPATIYVPDDYPTIQAAIDAAINGNTILGATGVYIGDGNRNIDFEANEIALKSEKWTENCIIDCQGTEAELHRGFYFHSGETSDACTIGVASGYVTVDGRSMFWKTSDFSEARQRIAHVNGSPYDYIGIRTVGSDVVSGLNEAGVAVDNTLVKTPGGVAYNYRLMRHVLENYANLEQIRSYVQQRVSSGEWNASGCFGCIDVSGNASIFEINRSNWFLEYDSMDPHREAQGLLGFVIRANEFHEQSDGTDNRSIGGRYESGTYNTAGLVDIDMLCARTIIQGNDGANGFEFLRYGPGRPLATIARSITRAARVIQGVTPGEDPALATMWVILGQSNYGIAVPAWVRVSDIPQCLSSGDMYDRAKSLYNKGNETTTQASTFPVEAHMFDVVDNTLLPHWRAEGVPSVAEMTRIEHRMANDAYSLLDCLDNHQSDNKAPDVTLNAFTEELTASFELIANDSDGTIDSIKWNFGDNQTSTEASPSHTYADSGTYLVSCTATDDDGVSLTDWRYCTINNTIPPASVTNLNESEVGTIGILWSWINPPDEDFYHTEVYINGMFMENVSAPEHSYRATELLPNTTYEIGTRTVDDFDNINTTWVNDTAKTFPSKQIIFATGSGTYPSIMGIHKGTITPNKTIVVHKMYTYPCAGTGGHTEYVRFSGNDLDVNKTWSGYIGDYHNLSFDPPITLKANITYNYEIRTGSYPQIIHEQGLPTANGKINCTQFTDANGEIYYDWIPTIRLE